MEKSPTSFVSLFKFFTLASMVALATSAAVLFSDNRDLKQKNSSLLEQSKKLEGTIQTVQDENKNLIEKIRNEKITLSESLNFIKRENESIQMELKKAEQSLDNAAEEKTYLEDILIHKTKEIERLKQVPGMVVSSAAGPPPASIAQLLKTKDEEIRKLSDQNSMLSKKLERLYKTTNEKISEINVAKITLEETISQARKLIEDEWNTVDLGSLNAHSAGVPANSKTQARKEPKKEGRVLAVNENHGFVVVDVGRLDGIQSDSQLVLKRNGKAVGTLSVLEIRDVMTACNIKDLNQGKRIQINDLVSIQK